MVVLRKNNMSSYIDWLIDMAIWEQATDALGFEDEPTQEEPSTQAQEEPISQPDANKEVLGDE